MFDHLFSNQTYAYRNNKSAISAADEIGRIISGKEYSIFLKIDISDFFDSISWNLLMERLRSVISEEDVIDLIHECSCSLSLDEITGELTEKRLGIYQGSV